MNKVKFSILCNTALNIFALFCIAYTSMYFGKPGILFWLLILPFIGTTVKTMAEIYILNLSYKEAIDVLNNINDYGDNKEDRQIVLSAIYKIKGMATINAVNKTALMNAILWLLDEAFTEIKENNNAP